MDPRGLRTLTFQCLTVVADTNKGFDEPFWLATSNAFQTRAVPCWWRKSHSNAQHTTIRQTLSLRKKSAGPKSLLLVVNRL